MTHPTKTGVENAITIQVRGLVQGVGFRPFIYRLAKEFVLSGWVENRNDCVQIKVQGEPKKIERFISSVKEFAPPASHIESMIIDISDLEETSDFQILKSKDKSDEITEISPDIAVCPRCLEDMKNQVNRINYPFINCTNCGPRFSIINELPYDREKTTMKKFRMCDNCRQEYQNISDHRFHAQPVACSICGPQYELLYGNRKTGDINEILEIATDLIDDNKIIAVKGLGGFFMMCNAQNEKVVKRLRKLKNRESKPFAVMFADIDTLKKYAVVNKMEKSCLQSWRRPVLLLREKKKLAESVNSGLNTIGAMLPFMPFHYLFFERSKTRVVVLTSGNISDEPIVIDNSEAIKKLSKISDAILIYNRKISNRTDDSVAMVVNNKERIIRRSRGYAPSPITLSMNVDGIIATGAELVNCFCVGKGSKAIPSQYIGDLKNIETYNFYCETIEKYKRLFRIKPQLIVSDMHPDYLSSMYADQTKYKKIKVQHHHAHIASCMAEHNIDEQVIGVSFDGVGYGEDKKIWGGEFLVCDLNEYNRFTHFEYVPMPGGDMASKEPWRMAISYLYHAYGKDFLNLNLPFLQSIGKEKINLIILAIEKKINTPFTSSAGRLFDAVAAITNLCIYSKFQAEAPMRLESVIGRNSKKHYNYQINDRVSFKSTIREIITDIKKETPVSIISVKFHNTIIEVIVNVVNRMHKEYSHINKVVLSGGTFQNRYILKNVENRLTDSNYQVVTHNRVPPNDGGIALGQLAIAAKRRELKCV